MSLRDEIRKEIAIGRVPPRFTVRDLLTTPVDANATRFQIGDEDYARGYVTTTLNNLRQGPGQQRGHNVEHKGATANFRKYADGTFSIIDGDELPSLAESPEDESEPPVKPKPRKGPAEPPPKDIACAFVEYLRNKPFRLFVGARTWYPTTGAVAGWDNRLNAYQWPVGSTTCWPANQATISKISADIATFLRGIVAMPPTTAHATAAAIYNDVRAWGNPRAPGQPGNKVLAAIERIAAASPVSRPSVRGLPLDSTWTKLYAFTRPDDFVIYDSRVAFAILSIAEDLFRRAQLSQFRALYPSLGHMNTAAASGTRPRGLRSRDWPNAYGSWNAQLEANSLCLDIRNCLNDLKEDGRSSWTLREVEAVLFMEGY